MALSRHCSSNRVAILNVQAPGSDNARTTSPKKRLTVLLENGSSKTTNVSGHLLHHFAQLQRTSSPTGILTVDCCSINPFIAHPLSKHDSLFVPFVLPNPPIKTFLLLYASIKWHRQVNNTP